MADVVVRNWGALIALMGAMLIYGARKPAVRPLALTVAGASKAIFYCAGALAWWTLSRLPGGIAVVVDLIWVVVIATYLLALRRMSTADLKIGTTIGTL